MSVTIAVVFILLPSLVLGYIILSLEMIYSEEKVVRRRLGKLKPDEIKSGLRFFWFLIDKPVRESRRVEQLEIPAEPHLIVRDENAPLGPGQRHPLRIMHSLATFAKYWYALDGEVRPKPHTFEELPTELQEDYLADPLSNRRLTTEIQLFVEWEISDLTSFLINVGSREEVNRRIEDVASSAAQNLLAPLTAGHTLTNKEFLSQKLRREVVDVVTEQANGSRPWGINVRLVDVKSISAGVRVSEAQADAVKAEFNKQEAVSKAEAARDAKIIEGQGIKEYETLVGEGEAARVSAVAKKLKTHEGKFAAQIQAGTEIASKAKFIIAQDPIGAISATFGKVLEEVKKTDD